METERKKTQLSKLRQIRRKPLFILISLILLCLFFLLIFKESVKGIEARDGVIDLSGVAFGENRIYRLGGQWLLYPNRFLDPSEQIEQAEEGIPQRVPGNWNDVFDPRGFATYRITVKLPDGNDALAILMPSLSTAFNLYVDGERLSSNGTASMTRGESEPEFRYTVVPIGESRETKDLIVHVSNFEYAKGGIWTAPMIGPEKAVTKYFQRRIFSETLISGGLILSGLILLTLFIIRHEFLSYANLGLFCVVMGIRTLIVGEIPLTYFFPGFNWNLMIRMEYLSMSIGFIFLNSYFFTIYNRFYSRKIFAFFNFLAVLFSIFTVLTPVYVFTGQVLIIQLLILAGIANIFYLFVKSGRVMKEENVILLTGISLLLILVIFDILMANNKLMFLPFKINTSYGLIILILVNSLLLVKQAARITLQLKRLTNNLEEQVHIRTAELEAVNRRLSEQAVTDLLTGVSNRHEFANVMKTEEARYLRTGKKYAALYLDLDNFKYINDTFGHPAGDLILQKFADMLKSIVRDSDYLFRMGGDEFFILMTDVPSAEEGEVLAKRILKETEKREAFRSDIQEFLGHPVRVPERKSFSLSIGVSSTETPGLDSLHTLPAWSDKALLRAKAEGKNRYAVFTLEDWDN